LLGLKFETTDHSPARYRRVVGRYGLFRFDDHVTQVGEVHDVEYRLDLNVGVGGPGQILPVQRDEGGIVVKTLFHRLEHLGALFAIGLEVGRGDLLIERRIAVVAGVILAGAGVSVGALGEVLV